MTRNAKFLAASLLATLSSLACSAAPEDDELARVQQAVVDPSFSRCVTEIRHEVDGVRVPKLRGHVRQAQRVVTQFTVPKHCQPIELTLVAYTALEPYWNPATAKDQRIASQQTGVFPPGRHRLEVRVPECFFQVDLVAGKALEMLLPPNQTYSAQRRLFDAANDGRVACECSVGSARTCYSGPAGTEGVGSCRAGSEACASTGRWSAVCEGAKLPTAEICNGVDDDCNGKTDEARECPRACTDVFGGSDCLAGEACDATTLDPLSLQCRAVTAPGSVTDACTGLDQCAVGNSCLGWPNSFRCMKFCRTDADCVGSGSRCGPTVGGQLSVCSSSCAPSSNVGCPSGWTCHPLLDAPGGTRVYTECRKQAGLLAEGAACESYADCADGATCVEESGAFACRTLCNRTANTGCERLPGTTCIAFKQSVVFDGVEYGTCR
jgi:hypothetical protein